MIGNNVPDLRGQFVRGWDNGRGLDTDSTRSIKSTQSDAIRNITGNLYYIAESWNDGGIADGAFEKYTGYSKKDTPSSTDSSSQGAIHFDASNVVPTANENRPTNIAMMYIIKAE